MEVRIWRHFDLVLIALTVLLVAYGLLMIYSATYQPERRDPVSDLVYRQGLYALLGFALMVLMITTDYRILGNVATLCYLSACGLLGIVLVLGRISHGAQRWIDLGIIPLQPSELAKLLVIVALAKYFAEHEEEIRSLRYVMISLLIVAVPAVLTFLQPDLGTAAILIAIWAGMAVMAGVRPLHWAMLGGGAVLSAPLLWMSLHGYMRTRLEVFLDPQSDPLGAGYNIIQALTAVGSGGIFGRGFTSGTQSQLHFLRVQYADFIFSVLAEELGFLGALVLFALIGFLLFRCLRVVGLSSDAFGRLLATGVVVWVAFQTFVNVGMNIRLLPVTGVPLPFISYGGSSLMVLLICIGMLESVVMRHKRIEF